MKSKPKVLVISEEAHLGGANTAIEEVCNQLSVKYQVTLLQLLRAGQVDWTKKTLSPKVTVINQEITSHRWWLWMPEVAIKVWRQVSNLTKLQRFETVLFNYAFTGGVLVHHPQLKRIKKSIIVHGLEAEIMWSQIPEPQRHYHLGWLKRKIFSGAPITIVGWLHKQALVHSDIVVATSSYIWLQLQKLSLTTKARLIPLGVNTQMFTPAKNRAQLKTKLFGSSQVFVMLCTSRFEARKGIHILLPAFKLWLKTKPNSVLVLSSPHDEFYEANTYVKNIYDFLNHEKLRHKVKILINHDRTQLLPYYQAADIFVFPSLKLETFGLVALEALACGTPVVTYAASGGPAEIVSGFNSKFLFQDSSPASLLKTLKVSWKLLNQPLRTRARAVAQQYSWSRFAEVLMKDAQS